MSKQIKFAKLFDSFFIPGVGTMTDTLPPPNKTLKDFAMYVEDNGTLLLSWTGPAGKAETFLLGVSMWKSAQPIGSNITAEAAAKPAGKLKTV